MLDTNLILKEHTEIWRTQDNGYTTLDAMEMFAVEYWDKPRQLEETRANLFTVMDGTQVYRIDYDKEIHQGYPVAVWIVSRILP